MPGGLNHANSPAALLSLQRSAGNQAALALLQRKESGGDTPWYGGIEAGYGDTKVKTDAEGRSVEVVREHDVADILPSIKSVLEKVTFRKNFTVWVIPMYVRVQPDLKVAAAASFGKQSHSKLSLTAGGTAELGIGATSEAFTIGPYGALSLAAETSASIGYDADKEDFTVAPFQVQVKATGKVGAKVEAPDVDLKADINKTLAEAELATISWGGYVNGVAQPATVKPGKDLLALTAWFEEQGAWLSESYDNAMANLEDAYDTVVHGETETDRLRAENREFDRQQETQMAEERRHEEAARMTEQIRKSSSSHIEAKAFAEAQKRRAEVTRALAEWTPKVHAARDKASAASWPWNKRKKEGEHITPEQARAYDPPNAVYNKAHKKYPVNDIRRYASNKEDVERVAHAAIKAYQKAEAMWKAKHHLFR